ncbi:MAG: EF-P lysine aminoacylase EpmA [Magnetococcus sp. DMHC-8]
MTGHPWRPAASRSILQQRARLLQRVRAFFWQRGVMEVETPHCLPSVAPELHQDPIVCQQGFLLTSPETAMKRLLAAGLGPIYQIGRAFRSGEHGALHNPEFAILEWYRPGWTCLELMTEVEALLVAVWADGPGAPCGPDRPAAIWRYADAFRHFAGVDPFTDSQATLLAASRQGVSPLSPVLPSCLLPDDLEREALLDLLLVQQVEPGLRAMGGAVFLVDFPPAAAAMARIEPGPPAVAKRFELYVAGVELANGYQELTDPIEQRARLLQVNRQRQELGKVPLPIDEPFLQALAHGMPECAGVALGLDRLVMLAVGAERIQEVMTFPSDCTQPDNNNGGE